MRACSGVTRVSSIHGGDIIVSSVQGEYTEFVFSVPSAKIKSSPIVTGREKEYGVNSSGLIPVEQAAERRRNPRKAGKALKTAPPPGLEQIVTFCGRKVHLYLVS